jgi:drug/metabolite transporter (DMT)-like permease
MKSIDSVRMRAFLCLAFAQIIVGSSVPVGKFVVDAMPVFLASAMRYGIAAAVLVPLLLWREGTPRGLTLRDSAILVVQAACGTFLFSVLLLYGLDLTTAAEGGVAAGVMPATVALFSVLLLGDRVTVLKLVAVGLAVLGLVSLNVGGDETGRGTNPLLGDLLVVGAIACESLFVILGKALHIPRSPLFISTVMSVLGFVMFAPVAVVEGAAFDFAAMTALEWGVMVYYGVVVTVIAFLLWFAGVEKVEGSRAGVFTGLLPVSALILSYAWLGEAFRLNHVAGCVLVLAAIALTVRSAAVRPDVAPNSHQ